MVTPTDILPYSKVQKVYAGLIGDNNSSLTHTNSHTGNDELRVYQENHVCTGNTTTTLLGANETFTGQWQDCLNYQEVNVSIVASHNSATNGLVFQWSDDGVIIGDTDVFSYYSANGGTNYTPNPAFRYVRMVYTNGATPQTTFHLMTILRRGVTGGSFHRIDSTLKDDSDGRLTLTVPKLKTAANTYVSQTATTSGNAKISIQEFDGAVATNVNKMNVAPYLTDEFGVQSQMLSDNIYTGAPVTIDVPHHEIHCGDSFTLSYNATLNNAANSDILLIVPNEVGSPQKKYHLTINNGVGTEVTFFLYEAPTTTNNGTALDWFNRERNSALTTSLSAFHTPTVTVVGTLIDVDRFGAKQTAAYMPRSEEFVLKNNTKYLLRITNNSGNASFVSWKLNHYIHPGI